MKNCRDVGALYAFSRLRAAEFAHLTTYLTECRDGAIEDLKVARNMEELKCAQTEIATLETILKYVAEGELLATKYQQK